MKNYKTRVLFIAIIACSVLLISWFRQMPHGENFDIECKVCHTSKGWHVDKAFYSFNHDKTEMPLLGQHAKTDCKLCHSTLIFSEAKTECASCHKDVHETTLGQECKHCHNSNTWLVENITQIHQQSRFPLIGVHASVECSRCHKSDTFLRYEVIRTDCFNCHSDSYNATTNPNHATAGFSTRCDDCHNVFSNDWKGDGFNHKFFPLTQGHSISTCITCHTNGTYSGLSSECFNCHQSDYNSTSNPNHQSLNFQTACNDCHSTKSGWRPANYGQHDSQYFRIYSGAHDGRWASCTDCHANSSNYSIFSCLECHAHNKSSMDSEHQGRIGYSYSSDACLHCHPTGSGGK
jgi:hypothetical protein